MHHASGRTVEPPAINRMLEAMAHRGPDGIAVWSDGSIGLGHGLLRTVPEGARQVRPMVDGDLAITADARLDNRDELLTALGMADRGISDAALILAAYRRWAGDCPSRLLGDFAFALWDCFARHLVLRPRSFRSEAVLLFHWPGPVHFCVRDQGASRLERYIPGDRRCADCRLSRFHRFGFQLDLLLGHPSPPCRAPSDGHDSRGTAAAVLAARCIERPGRERHYRAVPRPVLGRGPMQAARHKPRGRDAERRTGFLVHRLRRRTHAASRTGSALADFLLGFQRPFGPERAAFDRGDCGTGWVRPLLRDIRPVCLVCRL